MSRTVGRHRAGGRRVSERPAAFLSGGRRTLILLVAFSLVASLLALLGPPILSASASPRVADGLVALYEFGEGSGSSVGDTSGFGTALDLDIQDPGGVTWGPDGLTVDAATIISSPGAATKIINAVQASNEITVEAWVDPANLTQNGPARIVTISLDLYNRNMTLGQGVWSTTGDRIEARLRTTSTDASGQPAIRTDTATLPNRLVHVVYTRDASGRRLPRRHPHRHRDRGRRLLQLGPELWSRPRQRVHPRSPLARHLLPRRPLRQSPHPHRDHPKLRRRLH
ncbi:MAG: LamG domain-containing protein, partial [Actinobacteria bacterium]|nr:LamG domain-containing protein [Actinomycetota bacterium]